MKKASIILAMFISSCSLSSSNKIIVEIGDKKFTKSEFERSYKRNNSQLKDEQQILSAEDYMDLFIDYKLKVIEAQNHGLDTLSEFKDELKTYREELALQYLTDITITDDMVKEAYQRTITEIKASHILLEYPSNATADDSAKVYDKLIDIRNQFLNGEKTFAELAAQYSQDPSAKTNQGDLGYFKAFNMVADFEDAAYNTPVGEVSMPFETQHGLHIVYVTDKYESEGEIKVAHIMKSFKSNGGLNPELEKNLETEINEVYTQLKNGADWNEMVLEHSDDRSTIRENGEMQWFTKTFMVEEFSNTAFDLEKIGDISKPVRTPFGWHIIKLVDRREPKTFEELKDDLEYKIRQDPDRSIHSKKAFIEKLKSEYPLVKHETDFEKFTQYLEKQGEEINEKIPDSILQLKLYTVNNDKTFTVDDFIDLQKEKKQVYERFIPRIMMMHLGFYEDEVFILYENTLLEKKYDDFAQIVEEYHDGMLLFAIMQQEVWDKAMKDTTGLKEFYEQNKDKYLWDKHFEGMQIYAHTPGAYKKVENLAKQGITNIDTIMALINTNGEKHVTIREGKWEQGDNAKIDHLVFDQMEPRKFNKNTDFVYGEVKEGGTPKTLDEAYGFYVSDYQEVLEKQWIENLREKYPIKIHKGVLKSVSNL